MSLYSLPTCWICRETHKGPILAHNALENGAWFWLMTDARYIALPLISRYHCLDPTNRDISGLHCIMAADVRPTLYHGCWCPGSLRRQDISSHDIDSVEEVGSCLIWGRISTTCVISMWRNDTKCEYMFMFPLKNLARKGLMNYVLLLLLNVVWSIADI